jgi:aspartyl-tRNA(Asn)/glutamyl-tRNA(Gln) amidotransferase subunit A
MVPAVDYIRAQRVRTMLVRDAVKATEKFDAFVSPGGTGTGPRIGAPPAAPAAAAASPRPAGAPGGGARTLTMTNLTGHPSIVVPCGFRRGLPVGLVFSSNLFDEGAALRLALAYESATDWHRKRPAL